MMGTLASKLYQNSLKIVPNLYNEWSVVVLITNVNRKQHDKIIRQEYHMPHRYYSVSQVDKQRHIHSKTLRLMTLKWTSELSVNKMNPSRHDLRKYARHVRISYFKSAVLTENMSC